MSYDAPDPRPRGGREQVLRDPFWGAFRRRRPDVDVVVLPRGAGVPAADEDTGEAIDDPDEVVAIDEAAEATTATLWRACAAGHESATDTAAVDARWTSGPRRGDVRREVSRSADGVDPVTAALAVDRGAAALHEDGWQVTEPTGGAPRVLASRGEGRRREEVLLLAVVDSGRVVLRFRSAGVLLPRRAAQRLVTGGAP